MTSVYDLKPRFQALLRPLCNRLAGAGVTANQITLAAVALSVAAGGWIAAAPLSPLPYLALPLVLFLRIALNAVDGMLAREFDMKTPLGALLNELADVVSDVALYLPFGFHPAVPWWAIAALALLSVMIEFAGVAAVMTGASRRYDGPFGKSDRALAFGALGLLFGCGLSGGAWVAWALSIAIGLAVLTIVNRTRNALAEAGGRS